MRPLNELRTLSGHSIDDLYGNHPQKRIVEFDAVGVLAELRGYDDSFFIVYNSVSKAYEVHNIENLDGTYCFSCPALDGRIVKEAKSSDIRNRDPKAFIREINERNMKHMESKRKEAINQYMGIAEENYPLLKKALFDETFSD